MRHASLLLLGTFALSACATEISGPDPVQLSHPEGLLFEIALSSDEVEQHGTLVATVSATNLSGDTVRVVTSSGCLHTLHVVRNGARVPFDGTAWGCRAAITEHVFAPGETRSRDWTLNASLYAEHPGDVEGAPAPKGSYSVRAVFDTAFEVGGKPTVVARPLSVR